MRVVNILGATGSIGTNTLQVIKDDPDNSNLKVNVVTGNNNVELLARSAIEFNANYALTVNKDKYPELKNLLSGSPVIPLAGAEELVQLCEEPVDWTMNAIIGFAGLAPSLAVAKTGKSLALANKESLVCAGALLTKEMDRYKGILLPVDSEHNAIFQCLRNEKMSSVHKLILTASGGPFHNWNKNNMHNITLEEAVNHPNWNMGAKISIDSATMFNKALEVIEAKHLFNVRSSEIEVVIHRQSIIHSMVSFCDGSVIAQLGNPDMRGAIGYTLNYPERRPLSVDKLNLLNHPNLTFEKVDFKKFSALSLAYQVLESGGLWGTVLNAAKEVAVEKFIKEEIKFLDIVKVVEKVLQSEAVSKLENNDNYDINQVTAIDKIARQEAHSIKFV
ncbi:MAG: 1-deoxy-D-xylulose-5-phosphate reductoisomerase [Pseudomonadota bacterium]|nr:1-deoxy-D-xylulose-5-phosphate reductoisomerase [Pseudomonadota bacterium]